MKQQIDLLPKLLLPQAIWLTGKKALQLLIGSILIIALIQGRLINMQSTREAIAAQLTQQETTLRAEIATFAQKKRVLLNQTNETKTAKHLIGFSKLLTELAAYRVENFWLTDIQVNTQQNFVSFKGCSIFLNGVAEWFNYMGKMSSLQKKAFDFMQIIPDEKAGYVKFQLATINPEQLAKGKK